MGPAVTSSTILSVSDTHTRSRDSWRVPAIGASGAGFPSPGLYSSAWIKISQNHLWAIAICPVGVGLKEGYG
jgi:hypothetical protein